MKVLLVEDEPNVGSFIKQGLEEQSYLVDYAFDGMIGKQLALQNQYDLIILDIILPQINGIELCKIIRENNASIPIMMLTALSSTDDIVTGLDVGADDYLTKPFKFKELLARTRALVRRQSNNQHNAVIYTIADLELNTVSKTVKRSGQLIRLTSREYFLLHFFMRNKGVLLSRAEIAENVWEDVFEAGSNIIDVYVNYLRNKIDKNHSPKLIHTVVGMGYILREEV